MQPEPAVCTGMDGREALLARDVARAAAAWMNAPVDHEAYRRLTLATQAWVEFCTPTLDEPDGSGEPELLDEVDDPHPPQPLAAGMAELGKELNTRRDRTPASDQT